MERKTLCLALTVLFVVGCASARKHRSDPDDVRPVRAKTSRPSPEALARSCESPKPLPDGDDKPMAQTFVMTCPILPGDRWQDIARHALVPAARLGVLLECEDFYGAPERSDKPHQFRVVFYYPDKESDHAWLKVDPPRDLFTVDATKELSAEELQQLREKVSIQQEDEVYEECRSFLLDVTRAAKNAAQAQACTNAMAAIDRARGIRQQTRFLEQQAEFQRTQIEQAARQQQEMERIQREIEASREEAERRERRRRIGEAIQNAARAYQDAAQRPSGDTHCTPDLLGGMNCRSR